MSLSDEELDAIEARANAATPGPWKLDYPGTSVRAPNGYFIAEYWTGEDGGAEDAAFIASTRTDVPRLLADLRAARRLLERVVDYGDSDPELVHDPEMWRDIEAFLRGGGE